MLKIEAAKIQQILPIFGGSQVKLTVVLLKPEVGSRRSED